MPFVRAAAKSLLEQAIPMIESLPEVMIKSGQAVNTSIEGVFRECNVYFALFVEKDYERPTYKFLGFSSLTSLQSISASNYLMAGDTKRLIDYLSDEQNYLMISDWLFKLMNSAYNAAINCQKR